MTQNGQKSILVPEDGALGLFVSNLRSMIQQEMQVKQIPSIAVSISHECARVYTEGFGYQDEKHTVPVSDGTVFRAGSITKLFTDMALMLAVKEGRVSLEEPVSKYIPDFHPNNPFAVALNCRHLVSHTSGLAREPPRGHYFDNRPEVTLQDTVMSLNETSVYYEPGTTQKYSNAAIAVVGLVLERVYAKPWAQVMRELLLDPLGMDRSDFEWSERVKPYLAYGAMYSPDNRLDRTPPFFELGEAPAGSLYSTVTDMEKFANMIINGGALPDGQQLFDKAVLQGQILSLQFPNVDRKGMAYGFGIGWQLMNYAGVDIAAHGGAVYGYTARFVVATKKRFSLVLFTSGDCAMTTVKFISNYIIEHFGRFLDGAQSFPYRTWTDPDIHEMKRMEGAYYEKGDGKTYPGYGDTEFKAVLHLDQRFGKLMLKHDLGVSRLTLLGPSDTIESPYSFDVIDRVHEPPPLVLSSDMNVISWKGVEYERCQGVEPLPAVYPDLERFIGEYGPDHAPVFVFERFGRLFVLLEWVMQYPLHPDAGDTSVWRLPSEDCFYVDEKLIFRDFDSKGVPMSVECTGMLFERRLKDVSSETTFKIVPQRGIEELRLEAKASSPSEHLTTARAKPDLVDMSSFVLDPPFVFDIKYATEDNFMGAPFYKIPKAYAQRPAAESIVKAHKWLNQHGYGLVLYDIYRPWHVTKMFWEATPTHQRHFVANPETGSIHNRGCAVDCGLYNLSTGKQQVMVAGFDEMTPRSYRDYPGGTTRQRWLQLLLRNAMQMFDFEVYEYEWWHFNFASQLDYPVMNVAFEDLEQSKSL
jgi:CubicO group peptidase (beta-lactamase class C family)/D-alanyl-D-alanine dipeptidase